MYSVKSVRTWYLFSHRLHRIHRRRVFILDILYAIADGSAASKPPGRSLRIRDISPCSMPLAPAPHSPKTRLHPPEICLHLILRAAPVTVLQLYFVDQNTVFLPFSFTRPRKRSSDPEYFPADRKKRLETGNYFKVSKVYLSQNSRKRPVLLRPQDRLKVEQLGRCPAAVQFLFYLVFPD